MALSRRDEEEFWAKVLSGDEEQLQSAISNGYFDANRRDVHGDSPLHHAASQRLHKGVKHLLQHDAEVNLQDSKGYTPLHIASFRDDLDTAKLLIGARADPNLMDASGRSPLHYASSQRNAALASALIGCGAALSARDGGGATPLHLAALASDLRTMKVLIEAGAKTNVYDLERCTPLHYASVGSSSCMKILLRFGANVYATDIDGASPLHHCASGGNTKGISVLCDADYSLTMTKRVRAVRLDSSKASGGGGGGGVRIIKKKESLVEHRQVVELDVVNHAGSTALHMAAYNGHVSAVLELLRLGASVAVHDVETGSTPLHAAAFNGHTHVVNAILSAAAHHSKGKKKAKAKGKKNEQRKNEVGEEECEEEKKRNEVGEEKKNEKRDEMGEEECEEECEEDEDEELCSSDALAAVVNAVDRSGATALHKAAFSGHHHVVEALLATSGADAAPRDKHGATPLHKAAYCGHISCCAALLDAMVDINGLDDEGSTPLAKAAYSGHAEAMEYLISRGADKMLPDKSKGLPLHNASHAGSVDAIKVLLANDKGRRLAKSLQYTDKDGNLPIHVAAQKGSLECVQYLADQLAKAKAREAKKDSAKGNDSSKNDQENGKENLHDVPNAHGRTPLFYATLGGHQELAHYLIMECGSGLNAKDHRGRTPVDLALFFPRAVAPDMLIKWVDERDNPVADRLDVSKLTEEQRRFLYDGVAKFNIKPKTGIPYLIENKILRDTPESIAHFMYFTDKLDKEKMGEYLSSTGQEEVRVAFAKLFLFEELELDMAIRRYLYKFQLPGEGQLIDRLMEAFAGHYHAQNPQGVCKTVDAVSVLSYAVVMLNVDAHSQSLKKADRMSCEDFLYMVGAAEATKHLPKEYLTNLYQRIVTDEIKMEGTEKTWSAAERKGYLSKQGGRRKTWKHRWFVLKDNLLYYFVKPNDEKPLGMIPLEDIKVMMCEGKGKHKYLLRIVNADPSKSIKSCRFVKNGKMTQGHHEELLLSAPNAQERDGWAQVIQKHVVKSGMQIQSKGKPHKTPKSAPNSPAISIKGKVDESKTRKSTSRPLTRIKKNDRRNESMRVSTSHKENRRLISHRSEKDIGLGLSPRHHRKASNKAGDGEEFGVMSSRMMMRGDIPSKQAFAKKTRSARVPSNAEKTRSAAQAAIQQVHGVGGKEEKRMRRQKSSRRTRSKREDRGGKKGDGAEESS